MPSGGYDVDVMKVGLPPIWLHVATIFAGGLTELGFTEDERFLLVVSHGGRGVIDTKTGRKVARDHAVPSATCTWIDEASHTVEGIGPISGVKVACVGLWGGALSPSGDGWRLESRNDAFALIDETTGKFWPLDSAVTETRSYGFSKSGSIAVIATSSEIELYHRRHGADRG